MVGGFHVNEHVGHPLDAVSHSASNAPGNHVRLRDRLRRIDLDMQVDVRLVSPFCAHSFSSTPNTLGTSAAAARTAFIIWLSGIVSINSNDASRSTRTPVRMTMMPTAKPP